MTRRRLTLQLVEDALAVVGLVTVAVTAVSSVIVVARAVEGVVRERNRRRVAGLGGVL